MPMPLHPSLSVTALTLGVAAIVWNVAPQVPAEDAHPTAAAAWAELHCGSGHGGTQAATLIDKDKLLADHAALDQAAKTFGVASVCERTAHRDLPLIAITLVAKIGQ